MGMTCMLGVLFLMSKEVRSGACCSDGCTKIFQKPLDHKKLKKNSARGIQITSALRATGGSEVGLFGLSNVLNTSFI